MPLPRVSILLLSSLVAISVIAAAQAPEPQISGRVLRADNGQPIEGAAIELHPHLGPGDDRYQTAVVDSHGEYRFLQRAIDGGYTIVASADGFVPQTYSRDGTLQGMFQNIDASTRLREVNFQLKREAIIRGVVTDARGNPVGPGLHVAAVRKEKPENGSIYFPLAMTAETDGQGVFALKMLPAGTYFVCVNGPNGFNSFPDPGGWYREIWYGNVSSSEGAVPIALNEGEERNDVRIAASREQRYRVIVWPSSPKDQSQPDRFSFKLRERGARYRRQLDGSYVLPDVPIGHYSLLTVAWAGSQPVAAGEMTFDVTDADAMLHPSLSALSDVHAVLEPDDILGHLPPGLRIAIKAQYGSSQSQIADAQGRLSFEHLLPGKYQFELLAAPPGVTLRTVRCTGAQITPDSPLRIADQQKTTDCELFLDREHP